MDLGNWLQSYLMNQTQGSVPGFGQMRQNAYGNIDRGVNSSVMNQKENLASSGLFKSGLGQQSISNIYAGGSQAKGNFEAQAFQSELDYKNQAIQKLLGLYQYEDSKSDWFSQLMGSLLGAGGQVASAGMLSGWGAGRGR